MSILIQLKLLIWKNVLLRKRQKLRCIKELFWPLCLFLLLMWVRSKGFHQIVHQCYFEDKPLPSAGTLLYYQGVICALNNTCNEFYHKTERDYKKLDSSRFYILHQKLTSFIQHSHPWNRNIFLDFSNYVQQYVDEIQIINLLTNNSKLPSYFSDDFLKDKLEILMTRHQKLEEQTANTTKVLLFLEILENIDESFEEVAGVINENPIIDETFLKLHNFMCGNHSSPVTLTKILEQQGNQISFEKYLIKDVLTPEKYEYDPNFSPICNKIYEKLETSKTLKLLWRKVKPLARGKITFSPNTTQVVRMINKLKETMTISELPKIEFEDYAFEMDLDSYNKTVKNLAFMKTFVQNLQYKDENKKVTKLIKHYMEDTVLKAQHYSENMYRLYNLIEKLKKEGIESSQLSSSEIMKCYASMTFEGFNTEEEAEKRSWALCETNDFLAQISFIGINETTGLLPQTSYKIRMNLERLPKDFDSFIYESGPHSDPFEDLHLITYGLIYIQDIIEKEIIKELTGRTDTPGYILKQFPYPCHIQDRFMISLADMFPLFMVLSWVYTASMIIKNIVHEKEMKLKETMHILGLSNAVHWGSWFIDSFIPMTITVCILSIILVHGQILAKADISLVIAYLILYTLATITLCFLISVFFSKANIAASSGGIIFFMTYLPFPFIEYWEIYISSEHKIIFSLFSNVALGLGSKLFAIRELDGSGCTWSNWDKCPREGDYFSLKHAMLIMFIDSIIYLGLTWYLESVFPGNIGLAKPWYFPFDKNYWFPGSKYQHFAKKGMKKSAVPCYVNEPEPIYLKKGVEVQNLTKIYRNGKLAVNNLTINFYENQITAFLGRNGAGKTTTISILTGLFPPTRGTAKINGWDISTRMSMIRKSLGVCPQFNVHFRHFTVEEHLWFFARLKGHNTAKVQVEIQKILSDLNMTDKKNALSVHLSGGMKRKLSIAIAFIGGSRTVILDEPTAGIDPYSRKGIWDLLLNYKNGRTIIMTTHNMAEAELLGDRIAIFANGQVQCYGSTTFLKSRFGWGHILAIDFLENDTEMKYDSQMKDITDCIKSYVPEAIEVERFGSEIRYGLPKIAGNFKSYQQLFEYLDFSKEQLGIRSFGISDTTLEEIFLKIVDEDDEIGEKLEDIKTFGGDDDNDFNISNVKLEENKHFLRQFFALNKKRYIHTKRNVIAVMLQLLLPVVFVCMCVIITYEVPPIEQPKPKLVDHTNCRNCQAGFFEVLPSGQIWTQKYLDEFTKPAGLGIKCLKSNGKRDETCIMPSKIKGRKMALSDPCICSNGNYICPSCDRSNNPNKILISSGYEILDVTGYNVTEWIMDSWNCYERKRFGGYTFGIDISDQSSYDHLHGDISNEVLVPDSNVLHDNIMIWFNSRWKVSPVVYLNNMNNLVLRASLAPNISDNYGIKLYIHPMNYTRKQYEAEYRLKAASALLHAVSLIFALSFIPASFIMYLIEERVSGSKHLQFISGINSVLYWIHAFIWDMICYCFAIFVCILCLVIFKANAYINSSSLLGFITLLFLYGWSSIPLMYPASFYFEVPSSAFVSLSCVNIFFGVTTTATTHVLRIFHDEYLGEIEKILRNVLIIFPHFCLGEGILEIAESHIVTTTLAFYNVKVDTDLYSLHGLGKHNLSLFISGIIFFIFVLILEKYQNHGSFSEHKVTVNPPVIDDEDVINEMNRIMNNEVDDVLVLKCLTKVYAINKHIAVNQLCLGIKSKECFGLLGLNGAGKSTTFKMLTGDLSITFGDAFILGRSLRTDISSLRHHIGYCPQHDALDSLLTSQEHLEFYCDLRNIPNDKKDYCLVLLTNGSRISTTDVRNIYIYIYEKIILVKTYLKKFDLVQFKDVSTLYLSGGNRRKLSTAIAILGNTRVIFLDEPTSGMDPKGQRFLWSKINSCVQSGRAVVLTSHSMTECEALCSRITVMVNGQFKCLGSTQHLKHKYGRGYNLSVRVQEPNVDEVKRKILLFPEIKQKHNFCSQLTFEIETDILSLKEVFDVLEALSAESLIEDYSISQKSLEEIFLHFVQADSEK